MKRLKAICIIIFILTAAGFGYYQFKGIKNVDKLAPLISIDNKVMEVSTKDDTQTLLSGVTANDTKDGDVTSSIVIEGMSTFLEKGRRLVTYAALTRIYMSARPPERSFTQTIYLPDLYWKSLLGSQRGPLTCRVHESRGLSGWGYHKKD